MPRRALFSKLASPWCSRSQDVVSAAAPGTQLFPGDEIIGRVSSLGKFDQQLSSMSTARKHLVEAVGSLGAAQSSLNSVLTADFDDCAEAAELAPRLVTELEVLSARFRAVSGRIVAMDECLDAARRQSEDARELVSARNRVWLPKQRADIEAEALRRRFGRSYSLEEKKGRLQTKASADEAFKKAAAEAEGALDSVLSKRWVITARFLSEVGGCVSAALNGAQPLAEECGRLAECFARASSAEMAEATPVLLGRVQSSWSPDKQSSGSARSQALSLDESLSESVGLPPSPPSPAEPGAGSARTSPTATAVAPIAGSARTSPNALAATSQTKDALPLPSLAGAEAPGSQSTLPRGSEAALLHLAAASAQSLQQQGVQHSLPSPTASLPQNAVAPAQVAYVYSEGQQIEVWSSSEQAWLPGLVERLFKEEGVDEAEQGVRFKVPAGSIKVAHAKGFKYVRAEQVQSALRPR